MDPETREHHLELLRIYKKRYRLLELRTAEFGSNVEPAVVTEIANIQQEIDRLFNQVGEYEDDRQEDILHKRVLFEIHTKRLRGLQIIEARYGSAHVPPFVAAEIEETQRKIQLVSAHFVTEPEEVELKLQLLQAHTQRLRHQELRSAALGSRTEPHVIMDIDAARNSIKAIELSLLPGAVKTYPDEQVAHYRALIHEYTQRLYGIEEQDAIIGSFDAHHVQFEIEIEDIKRNIHELKELIVELEPLSIQVFVSYSRNDWPGYASTIVEQLRAAGLTVWVDQHLIEGGQDWLDEINHALKTHEYLILCVSPDAMNSQWVKMEYRYFINKKRPVFPIICREAELPAELLVLEHYQQGNLSKLIDQIKKRTRARI